MDLLENIKSRALSKTPHVVLAETAILSNPGFAAMMVRQGDTDGTLGGAVATTADTVRVALQIIGKAQDTKIVSSFF